METQFLNNFIDILDDEPNFNLELNSKFRDLDEWDSLTALSLIAMMDSEYNITISGDQLKNLETLADIFNLIK
jgi:acyl carrier protein